MASGAKIWSENHTSIDVLGTDDLYPSIVAVPINKNFTNEYAAYSVDFQ
jgi:hypothetical protein